MLHNPLILYLVMRSIGPDKPDKYNPDTFRHNPQIVIQSTKCYVKYDVISLGLDNSNVWVL